MSDSDEVSDFEEYDRYSSGGSDASDGFDRVANLDEEIRELKAKLAVAKRRRRHRRSQLQRSTASGRSSIQRDDEDAGPSPDAEVRMLCSRVEALQRERLVAAFHQQFPDVPAEKVRLVETARGCPDIVALQTDDQEYQKGHEVWHFPDRGFYRVRCTRPATDAEIQRRVDELVDPVVKDIEKKGFRATKEALGQLGAALAGGSSYTRTVDYNGYWQRAAASEPLPLWDDVIKSAKQPVIDKLKVEQAPPLATTTSVACHGPMTLKYDSEKGDARELWSVRGVYRGSQTAVLTAKLADVEKEIKRLKAERQQQQSEAAHAETVNRNGGTGKGDDPPVTGQLALRTSGNSFAVTLTERRQHAWKDDSADDSGFHGDGGSGDDGEQEEDELELLRQAREGLKLRLDREKREVVLGNVNRTPHHVMNVSYRRDASSSSGSGGSEQFHVPASGPLFGKKLPQQRALPLRASEADAGRMKKNTQSRSPAYARRPRSVGKDRGGQFRRQADDEEAALREPIEDLLAQLYAGAVDPLQLETDWQTLLMAYLRHIVARRARASDTAPSARSSRRAQNGFGAVAAGRREQLSLLPAGRSLGPFKETPEAVLSKLKALREGQRWRKPRAEETAHWTGQRWWSEIKATEPAPTTLDDFLERRNLQPPTPTQRKEMRLFLRERRDALMTSGAWQGAGSCGVLGGAGKAYPRHCTLL
eukprot:SAG22_NODE_80_length_21788_cov_9.742542_15_plen_704_part_00